MDSDSDDDGNSIKNTGNNSRNPKSSKAVLDLRNGIQKRSQAIGLKAASIAATVNTYRRKISQSISQESDKERKISKAEDITLSRAARDDLLEIIHQRLQEKCNVNEVDEDGLAALHHRTRYNRVGCVKILLDAGADINIKGGHEEMTPLHIACRYNSADVVQLLVASGADLNATDSKGKTPLHYATRRGFTTAAKMLLAATQCRVDAADNDRTTPLHMAAMQGSSDVVDSLISRGAKVDARDINDMTPLMWASAEGHCDVIKILLQRSSRQTWNERRFVHAQDNEGNTALHFAVMNGKYEATELLLEQVTNVNAQKNNLQTPLHIAATNGFLEILRLLLKHGAEVDLCDNNQRTPVHYATHCNRVDILNELMSHGANLNCRDSKHMSPLHCACWKGQTEAIQFLLDNGAQVAETDCSLMTVLHLAVQYGHYDTLTLLLQHTGPSLTEAKDRNDQTVLHYASSSGNSLVLKALLEHGARCDAKDNEERTPLHIAAQCGNVQCIEALIERSKHETNDDDVEGRTPLLLASMQGHQQVVQLLLLLGADISSRDDEQRSALMLAAEAGHQSTMSILLANHAVVNDVDKLKNTALHYACSGGYVGAVQMLLQARTDVTVKNTRDQSALDIAIDNLYSEVAMVMLRHDSWRQTLSVRDKNGCTPFDRLIARLPDAAMAVLDRCVEQSSRDEEDTNLTLNFDYHYIDPGPEDPANKRKRYLALNTMIQHGRDDLLSHVVCQNILSHKWTTFGRKVFYANLILFILYMIILTGYTWKIGNIAVTVDFDIIAYCPVFNNSYNQTVYNHHIQNGVPREDLRIREPDLRAMAFFLCFFSVVFFLREAFKLFQRDWRYLLNPYTWIVLIQAVTLFAFIHPYGYYPCLIQWRAGWLAHFLAWMNFIFYLRKFDFIGIYIIMFEAVFVSLLKAILIYFFFCWAFTGSFYIILARRHRAFTSMDDGVLNVLTMTLGEIEFVDNFIRDPGIADPFKIDAYILLAIFLFLMPIVLINLMIGVAVGDIEKIQRNAYLKRIALQVELLYNIENTLPKFVQKSLYQRRAVVKPNEKSANKCCSCLQSLRTHISGKKPTQFISVRQRDRIDHAVELLERQLISQSRGLKSLQQTVVEQTNLLKHLCEKLHPHGLPDSESFVMSPDRRSSYDNYHAQQMAQQRASLRR